MMKGLVTSLTNSFYLASLLDNALGTDLSAAYGYQNTTIEYSDDVNCLGYQTCAYSNISSTGSFVLCDASRSCLGSENVYAYERGFVSGYMGLAFSKNVEISYRYILCYGEYSCMGIEDLHYSARSGSYGHVIYCNARAACAHSVMHGAGTPTVYLMFGMFSGYNATIIGDDSGNNDINVTMKGFYAGYSMEINCQPGASCEVCSTIFVQINCFCFFVCFVIVYMHA